VAAARRDRLPVIYHIDDNLLAVPEALGPEKFARYNDPRRIAALEGAMRSADFIYASTTELARQLRERLPGAKVVAGDIYCAHAAVVGGPSAGRGPMTVGYMGTSGHVRDLDMVVPAMTRLLERHSDLRFETFGTIKMPAALTRFGERVAHHAGLADYDAFMRRLASLGWHIGLAPIIDSPFNRCKADTKWVEYTAAGIAVAASDLPVYSRACGDGAGLLVAPDGWTAAVQSLVESEARRHALVASAQARLSRQYSPERLRQQVLGLLAGERMSEAAT
jgi:glycosyltransferase involved in cell wall biosynthesis